MPRQTIPRDGFTLVETLIVVAILGLLAAIAIPMWLNSVNRTKQTQTVANIRQIAGAWEARAADYKAYTAAGGATFTLPPTSLDPDDASALLVPTYIRSMPKLDGWRRPLEFWTNADDGNSATEYALRSFGRDGEMDTKKKYTIGPTHRFDCDIVYANGAFIVYPEGTQKE